MTEVDPEIHKAAIAFFNDLLAGKCPICHEVPQYERQVGRCVYGVPCGHRMRQGKADASKVEHQISEEA